MSIAHSIFDTWDFGMRCLALSFLVCCAAAEPARVVVVDPETGAQFRVERSALKSVALVPAVGAGRRLSTTTTAAASMGCNSTTTSAHGGDPTNGLMYLACVSLVFGWIFRKAEHFGSNLACCGHSVPSVVPFTVLVLFSGMGMGMVEHYGAEGLLGTLGYSMDVWQGVDPHMILYLFIPPLIFASAHHVDFHVVRKSFVHIMYLATLGVVLSTALTAAVAKWGFIAKDFNGWECLAFGAMLSATDPVAVVALLNGLGAPPTLSILIEGESLFNDGTAYVFFMLFVDVMGGATPDAAAMVGTFAQLALGGAALGFVFGMVLNACLRYTSDGRSEILLTVIFAYATFIVAEWLSTSGVLAVVICGFQMARNGRPFVSHPEELHMFWEEAELICNTMIFSITGLIVVEKLLLVESFATILGVGSYADDAAGAFSAYDFVDLGILYLALQLIRAAVVFSLVALDGACLSRLRWRHCRCQCARRRPDGSAAPCPACCYYRSKADGSAAAAAAAAHVDLQAWEIEHTHSGHIAGIPTVELEESMCCGVKRCVALASLSLSAESLRARAHAPPSPFLPPPALARSRCVSPRLRDTRSDRLVVDEYPTSWRAGLVATWGGLRGAVGLALALIVEQEGHVVGKKFLFMMSGIAFLTLVVNGSTTGALVHQVRAFVSSVALFLFHDSFLLFVLSHFVSFLFCSATHSFYPLSSPARSRHGIAAVENGVARDDVSSALADAQDDRRPAAQRAVQVRGLGAGLLAPPDVYEPHAT